MKKDLQAEARALGDTQFYAYCATCKVLAPHYTSGCYCIFCRYRREPRKARKKPTMTKQEYAKAYYWANRERLLKAKREAYHEDIELSRMIGRIHRQNRKISNYLRQTAN